VNAHHSVSPASNLSQSDPSFFLPVHTCCISFNINKPCPHPSLEGRGDVVFVDNIVLAALEWWMREIFCNKAHSVEENI
jgi:hypothetical protein